MHFFLSPHQEDEPSEKHDGQYAADAHGVIDHAECYVKGAVHTNGLENFWSLVVC